MTSQAMDHERCSELLGRYIAHDLNEPLQQALEGHLEECDDCSRERDALTALASGAGDPLTDTERSRLHSGVGSALAHDLEARTARGKTRAPVSPERARRRRSWREALAPGLAAAALVAVAASGYAVFTGLRGTGEGASSTAGGGSGAEARNGAATEDKDAAARLGSGRTERGERADPQDLGARYDAARSLRPGDPAEPLFERGKPSFDRGGLDALGRTGRPFVAVAADYRAQDTARLAGPFLDYLAARAPEGAAAQVEACARPLIVGTAAQRLPAYAALGTLRRGGPVLIIGFVEAHRAENPLHRYSVWAWARPKAPADARLEAACASPVALERGRVAGS